ECTPRARARDAHDFALTDEARGKLRRAPMLTPRAAQDERIAAILDEGLRLAAPIGRGHLRNRLKAEHAAPAEFSEACERILQPVDLPEDVQLVDHEPEGLLPALHAVHRLEDRKSHPRRDRRAQRRDLTGAVR